MSKELRAFLKGFFCGVGFTLFLAYLALLALRGSL